MLKAIFICFFFDQMYARQTSAVIFIVAFFLIFSSNEVEYVVQVERSIVAVEMIRNHNCILRHSYRMMMNNNNKYPLHLLNKLCVIRKHCLFKVENIFPESISLNWFSYDVEFNECEKQLVIGYCNRIIRVFTSMVIEDFDGRLSGRFVLKHVLNITEQIHTLNWRRISTKDYELIVGQPDGNLLRLNPNEDNGRRILLKTISLSKNRCSISSSNTSNGYHQPWCDRINRSNCIR